MNEQLIPARVVSPGRILQRELEARGWTQKDLANIVQRPTQAINQIIKGSKRITPETAMELADAFGTNPAFWTNLEANYRLHVARKEHRDGEITRTSRLYSMLPLGELIKRGWIPRAQSLDELEKEVCAFLGIRSLEQTPSMAVSFRHGNMALPERNAQVAWLRRVELMAEQQPSANFSVAKLKSALADILACAEHAEDIARVPALLKDLGVRFVIVPHLPKTFIDGVVLKAPRSPVVALSLRYARIDSFWFTLMHELAHIMARHRSRHVEQIDDKRPLDPTIEAQEHDANRMATQWLVDQQALSDFVQEVSPRFSKSNIEQFATNQKRHPGIVVGQLQHQGHLGYAQQRGFLIDVKCFLTDPAP